MSDDGFNDSFEQFVNSSQQTNQNLFAKLFSTDFEDEDILFELSTDDSYPNLILNFDNYCKSHVQSQDLDFEYISGLIHLLQKLSQLEDTDILQLWITSNKQKNHCILSKIFEFLPNCYLELCLPKFTDLSEDGIDDSAYKISFYEHLALNVCKFVATLTPQLFHDIEPLLLKQLLSEQSVCHILASDILCFVCRLSEKPICYQLCVTLWTIAQQLSDSRLPNVVSLLNRLLPFLRDMEMEYLLKDYEVFANPRIWRHLDISRVLNESQINQILNKLFNLINDGKPFDKYILDVIENLCTINELDADMREKLFQIFSENFFYSDNCELSANLLRLMTVLMPQELDDYFIDKLCDKYTEMSIQNHYFETHLLFFTRLAQTKTSYSSEKRIAIQISCLISKIYNESYNYYEKFNVLKTILEISTKTTLATNVLEECLKNNNLRQEFRSYVKKVEAFQKFGERMYVNDKIKYIQSFVNKLRAQKDFKTNELNCRISPVMSQMLVTMDNKQNGSAIQDLSQIDSLIETIGKSVNLLKEESVFSEQQILKINAINVEFNELVFKITEHL